MQTAAVIFGVSLTIVGVVLAVLGRLQRQTKEHYRQMFGISYEPLPNPFWVRARLQMWDDGGEAYRLLGVEVSYDDSRVSPAKVIRAMPAHVIQPPPGVHTSEDSYLQALEAGELDITSTWDAAQGVWRTIPPGYDA